MIRRRSMDGECSCWLVVVCYSSLHSAQKYPQNLEIDGCDITACFGGMLFGQDIGAISGVIVMPPFMEYITPLDCIQ